MADKKRPLTRAETLRRLGDLTTQILRIVADENALARSRAFPRSIDPELAVWFKDAFLAYRAGKFPSLYAALTKRPKRRGPKAGKNKKLAVAVMTYELRVHQDKEWSEVVKAVQAEHGAKGHDAGNLRRLLREYKADIKAVIEERGGAAADALIDRLFAEDGR